MIIIFRNLQDVILHKSKRLKTLFKSFISLDTWTYYLSIFLFSKNKH